MPDAGLLARGARAGDALNLPEHFFRHASSRLVAMLARRAGMARLALVEDAVQGAMLAALTTWPTRGVPDVPEAWLHRVARNNLAGALRREGRRSDILEQAARDDRAPDAVEPGFEGELRDGLLRMMFVCCDEELPMESRVVLALRTLCGFSAAEIAARLMASEANVQKRLTRARESLRERAVDLETPDPAAFAARLPGVHAALYVLFNEGYLSSRDDEAIRRELCDEALRLTRLLAGHAVATPETFALLALMELHAARLDARVDALGGLVMLEEQDRARWDRVRIAEGLAWLARSATGERFTRFHAEAGIAAEHCLAPSFRDTRWAEIARLHAMLEVIDPSPLHRLNRALAIAECDGPAAALALLEGVVPPSWLAGHHLWAAVLSDLHRRAGNAGDAARLRDQALRAAPSARIREVLERRLRG